MNTVYPPRNIQHPREPRDISLLELPPRSPVLPHHTSYLTAHGIPQWILNPYHPDHSKTVYPCGTGLVFVLYGESIGFQIRFTTTTGSRFWTPPGFQLGRYLYVPSLERITSADVVYLVEGNADAIAVYCAGKAAIALIGSNITAHRLTLIADLTHGKRVGMIPDNDLAGEMCCERVRSSGRFPDLTVLRLPPGMKDICDMPVDDRARFLRGLT